MKIFGREPTLLVASLASALSVLVGFHFDWLTAEQAALIVAFTNAILGVVNALAVRPIAPAAFTYLVGAVAALAAAYGLGVSQEMVGSINALVLSVLMFLTRGQVTPIADPKPIAGAPAV
jgi:hypothetical protein